VRALGLAGLCPVLFTGRCQSCSAAVDSSSAVRVLVFWFSFCFLLLYFPAVFRLQGLVCVVVFARVFLFLRRLSWFVNKVWLLKKK